MRDFPRTPLDRAALYWLIQVDFVVKSSSILLETSTLIPLDMSLYRTEKAAIAAAEKRMETYAIAPEFDLVSGVRLRAATIEECAQYLVNNPFVTEKPAPAGA